MDTNEKYYNISCIDKFMTASFQRLENLSFACHVNNTVSSQSRNFKTVSFILFDEL